MAQGLPRRVLEHRAQQVRQADQESVGGGGVAMEQRRDRLDGVEEKMGMELTLRLNLAARPPNSAHSRPVLSRTSTHAGAAAMKPTILATDAGRMGGNPVSQ
jgi:hypothetical protein